MNKTISAIYEHGVIRPLKKLPLSEHQRIKLQIAIPESTAKATKAIIYVKRRIGRLVAESSHFSPLES